VVQSRIGSCGRFFNEPVLNESLDRSIESARAETHFAFRSRGHLFHDAVTMQLPVGQGEENGEYRDGQWQQTLRISFHFFHVRSILARRWLIHRMKIYQTLDISPCQAINRSY